ncbi:hypothetical protein BC831DRAFT_238373 [Entophlyctis helioformis]|nr:hypothetical protein BC831DRAFT_238373 [Entophlyctis helioformis]
MDSWHQTHIGISRRPQMPDEKPLKHSMPATLACKVDAKCPDSGNAASCHAADVAFRRDLSGFPLQPPMENWTVDQVAAWLASLGLANHESAFRENNITGDLLVHADHDMLKELDIATVGERIALLKAVYNIKVKSGIPIEEDDYVPESATPPSASIEIWHTPALEGLVHVPVAEDGSRFELMISEQARTIERLNAEVAMLSTELRTLKDDLRPVWMLVAEYKTFQERLDIAASAVATPATAASISQRERDLPAGISAAASPVSATTFAPFGILLQESAAPSGTLGSQGSLGLAGNPSTLSAASALPSAISGQQMQPVAVNHQKNAKTTTATATVASASSTSSANAAPSTTSSIFASITGHGGLSALSTSSAGKTSTKSPAKSSQQAPFSMSLNTTKGSKAAHGDDLVSPVSARPAVSPGSVLKSPDPDNGTIRVYGHRLPNRENESYKSFRVNIMDNCMKIIPEVLKKYKVNENWQNYALFVQFRGKERCLSFNERPLVLVNKMRDGDELPEFYIKHIKQVHAPGVRVSALPSDVSAHSTQHGSALAPGIILPLPASSVAIPTVESVAPKTEEHAMAVAVYEYSAQRDDEMNVEIGDMFVIVSRETGWFVVEKNGRRGWVPAGCLLESNVVGNADAFEDNDVAQTGTVLHDYEKMSPNELTIHKGDALAIHRKFQHWLLVDCRGDHGWVPSCYVSIVSGDDAASRQVSMKSAASAAPPNFSDLPDFAGVVVRLDESNPAVSSKATTSTSTPAASRTVTANGASAANPNIAVSTINTAMAASVAAPLSAPLMAGRATTFPGAREVREQETQQQGPQSQQEQQQSRHGRSASDGSKSIANKAGLPSTTPTGSNTALSKLSTLLDSINPYLSDIASSNPSMASLNDQLDAVNASQQGLGQPTNAASQSLIPAPESAPPQPPPQSGVRGSQPSLAVAGGPGRSQHFEAPAALGSAGLQPVSSQGAHSLQPLSTSSTAPLSAPLVGSQMTGFSGKAAADDELSHLGQLLQQTDRLLSELQGEVLHDTSSMSASSARGGSESINKNTPLSLLVSAREMVNVLLNRLCVHGSHVISSPVYQSVVQALDKLIQRGQKRVAELRQDRGLVVQGGSLVQRSDTGSRTVGSSDRDGMIKEAIDQTYNALAKIVALLLEDVKTGSRAFAASAGGVGGHAEVRELEYFGVGSAHQQQGQQPLYVSTTTVDWRAQRHQHQHQGQGQDRAWAGLSVQGKTAMRLHLVLQPRPRPKAARAMHRRQTSIASCKPRCAPSKVPVALLHRKGCRATMAHRLHQQQHRRQATHRQSPHPAVPCRRPSALSAWCRQAASLRRPLPNRKVAD